MSEAERARRLPGGLTIVGLGPGGPGSLTRDALDVLLSAPEVWLRDQATLERFRLPEGPRYRVLESDHRSALAHLARLARRTRGAVFAAAGDPLLDDPVAADAAATLRARGLPVRILPGPSLAAAALAEAGLTAAAGVQTLPARAVADALPLLQPQRPLVVTALEAEHARHAVEALTRVYPPDARCAVVRFGHATEIRWSALAEAAPEAGPSALTLPPLEPVDDARTFSGLRWVVGQLRRKCPWDRQQTHASLKGYLLEEAYETLAALDEGNVRALSEELGDLMLQILLHVEIAEEQGEFRFEDVTSQIATKLVRRHPHVFGEVQVESAAEVAVNWEAIKRRERGVGHLLDAVPLSMPALAQAQSLLARAARAGFEWQEARDILDKIDEELGELAATRSPAERLEEFGDLLFALTSLARRLDVDAEEALRLATRKFRGRFARMEALASAQGRALDSFTLDELLALWRQAKDAERERAVH
ncbi:MAG TPA: nucleoside triphosphate pyrophosphohydrolase [Dehalococcoidia bacterium]|nr:nucleoside triphosphate pyrophosphohydrolase [Dehalococcoidia bacterium]